MGTTIIDLLRHGELEGGIKYRGNIEEALTVFGRRQMDETWARIETSVQVIVTSPLKRCSTPAKEWAVKAAVPCVVEAHMREMEYGAWEGLGKDEIEAKFPGMLAQWRTNPVGMQIPGAENVEDFVERVRKGWRHILQENEGKHVLVVGHSGSLRVILAGVLGAPLPAIRKFSMPYGCWSRVQCNDGKLLLEFFNRQL